MPSIIDIKGLSKKYGPTLALDDIDLSIDTTEPIGLVGKNGAGKTTLLSILSGAIRQTSGTVKVLDYQPGASRVNGRLSILLQDADFKRGIPVLSQLLHFARLQGQTKQQARSQISDLLEKLNNADYAGKKPETLSYGQRKRLGIVQALIGDPELVLLDEPTAGLDPIAASDVRQFIQTASKQATFIVSSHNLYEIEDICSRIIILDKGRLIINSKISEFSDTNNRINLTLDRAVSHELRNKLLQLADIINLITNETQPEKLTIEFSSKAVDELQLQIQSIIIEQGIGIVQLNRGKTLADGVIDLVTADK